MDMNVQIYFGVYGIDKSRATRWNANYIGKVIFDRSFSIYPPKA
jgi:hypothetical protein